MTKEEGWHRRHAVMLASQLPEKAEDGLIILRLATQLVTGFLAGPEDRSAKSSVTVLRAVPDPTGGAT
jgi:hypothetical protein